MKYRVKQEDDVYYPQFRWFGIWRHFTHEEGFMYCDNWDEIDRFSTLRGARDFIARKIDERACLKAQRPPPVTTITTIHPYP